ncbi:MAG: ATP-binding protein [Pseudomonadota bacterium]
MWQPLRLLFFALLVFSALATQGFAHASQPCDPLHDIKEVRRTVLAADGQTSTAVVSVPDRLPLALRHEDVRIHYEIDVGDCARSGLAAPALWIFRVGAPYRIEADGVALTLLSANQRSRTGPFMLSGRAEGSSNSIYNGRIPALFSLPPGVRSIRLELQTLPYMPAGLVRLVTGPTHALLPLHVSTVHEVVGYADAASGVVLVLGLLAFLLWLPRRQGMNLLWLAMACGLWGLRGIVYYDNTVPGLPILYEQLNPVNALLSALFIALAVLHLLSRERTRARRVLSSMTLLILASFVITGLLGHGALVARSLAQIGGTGMICWLGYTIWQRRRLVAARHVGAMMVCLLVLLGSVAHDLMVVAMVLPPTSHSYVFWGFLTVLVGFALMSGEYVVLTLNRAELANEELEQHVASKTEELQLSYERLRSSEHDAARVQERERLLRDMHDGLGAQLMTALRGVERGALAPQQVAQSLQDSLDELRLLMDSTDQSHYLPGALAAWRNRWDARLAAAGVRLDWHIDDSLDAVQLSSDVVLQVMRILQEAATNIVKHSQAQHMTLSAKVQGGEKDKGSQLMCIEIADNGIGLQMDAVRAGARGLKNMHYRASQIGAELTVAAQIPPLKGCRVVLRLPLAA